MSSLAAAMLVLLLALWSPCCLGERDGRWFAGRPSHTKIEVRKDVVTQVNPSSCVVVQPSLPPCRSLRAIDIAPSPPTRVDATDAVELPSDLDAIQGKTLGRYWYRHGSGDVVESSEPPTKGAWGAGWWGTDTVITSTVHEAVTRQYIDPNLVVTFSVTGCRPSRMPFDLDLCEEQPKMLVTKVIGGRQVNPTAVLKPSP